MSFELAFRSRVAFIMETLTATALQDICQFMEETYAALRVEILQEQNRSSTTKLHAMENSEGKEKPANSVESVQEDARSSGFRNFPVVEQILNEQEANGLWLEGDPTVEDEGPPSLVPEEEQPLQPFGQMTDKGVETCSAPLVIKQEETDDDVKESQVYLTCRPYLPGRPCFPGLPAGPADLADPTYLADRTLSQYFQDAPLAAITALCCLVQS
ncbi:uncharacterized protein [Salvelinus alpinus]|uniref:uncharacterized protein isoform X3 n=1 Tax=Salvelinus alpinus TaxID=8036 RepID=UPI0039FD29A2